MDFKNYFYNLSNFSDSEIKKFILEFTNRLDPYLVIALNKDFVNTYLSELNSLDEQTEIKTFDIMENLVEESDIGILIYNYKFSSDGKYETEEITHRFENLNYSQHRKMAEKIYPFQFCMNEMIKAENDKTIKQFPLSLKSETIEKEEILIQDSIIEPEFNRNNFNKRGFDLFNYLIENYEKKGNIKFINIYSFLRNEIDKSNYLFRFKQYEYTAFIQKTYDIKITKYQTAEYGFEEEKSILNSLEKDFRGI